MPKKKERDIIFEWPKHVCTQWEGNAMGKTKITFIYNKGVQ